VALLLEGINVFIELRNDWADVLKVVLLESLELLHSSKELNKLCDSSTEQVKLSEDLVR